MTSNPVLIREFLTSLRTKRASALAVAFLLVLAGLVMLMWPEGGVYSLAAQSSQKLFITLSLGLLTMVCLCAPAFTAVSITSEKEQRTYDLLYHTLLRPSQIMTGKFVAGVGYVLILIICSIPMMGACFILGGVSVFSVFKVYLIVTLAALFFGFAGLLFSAMARSSFRALIFCYILIMSVCGLTWVPSVVLGLWAESVHAIHLVRALSPYAAVLSVINPDRFQSEHPLRPGVFGEFADSYLPFALLAVAGTLVCLLIAYIKMGKAPQPRARKGTEIIENKLELIKRHVKFPFYLLDPRKRKRMIGHVLNIIFVKEMRCKAFGRSVWLIRSMYLALLASLVLAFLPLTQINKIGIETIAITCVSLPLGLILLMSPVLTATCITEERENRVFDMLRCTRLSAWTIVIGKLQVAWFFLALLIASTFPTFFVLAYINCQSEDMEHLSEGVNLIRPFNFQFAEGWRHLVQVNPDVYVSMFSAFAVVFVAMILATVIAVCVSAHARRSAHSTAISYGIVLAWAVCTLLPSFVAENLPAYLVRWSMTLNPFVAAANAVSTEAFTDLPARLWIQNIQITFVMIAVLLLAAWWRVRTMMKPQKN